MSYFVDEVFYNAGLPDLFKLENDFTAVADNADIAVGVKFDALSSCLDDIWALIDKKQQERPADSFYLIDEAARFMSDNSPLMARGVVSGAFSLSASPDGLNLHGLTLLGRLDGMSTKLEALLTAQALSFRL